jgi:hypothetical protein
MLHLWADDIGFVHTAIIDRGYKIVFSVGMRAVSIH